MKKEEIIRRAKSKLDYQKKVYGYNALSRNETEFNAYEEIDFIEFEPNKFQPKRDCDHHSYDYVRRYDIEFTNFLLYQVLKKLDRLIKKK